MNIAAAMTLPLTVPNRSPVIDTVRGMGKWGNYWRDVCAPKLLARKKELGRKVPERDIATAVETATGKPSERSLVWMWLHGEREPFVSQFFALCEKLDLEPAAVLIPSDRADAVRHRTPLRRVNERAAPQQRRRNRRSGG